MLFAMHRIPEFFPRCGSRSGIGDFSIGGSRFPRRVAYSPCPKIVEGNEIVVDVPCLDSYRRTVESFADYDQTIPKTVVAHP